MKTRPHSIWWRKPGSKGLNLIALAIVGAGIGLTASSVQAQTYIFNDTAAGSYNWSAGTGWNAAPMSGGGTALTIFNPNTTSLAINTSRTLNNDLPGTFLLNQLNFQGVVPNTNGTTTVALTGGPLSFVGDTSEINLNANRGNRTTHILTYTVDNSINLSDGLTLNTRGSATFTFNGAISGNGPFIFNGRNGTTNFSGGILTTGSFIFNSIATATVTTLGGSGDMSFNITGGTTTVSGAISRTGDLVKSGNGLLVLQGANTSGGSTTIEGGALRVSADNALSSGNLVLNGGVLELNHATNFTRSLGTGDGEVQFTGDGGFIAINAARTVNLGGTGATVTWGSGGFVGDGHILILGTASNHTLTFQNGIDLGSQNRTIQANGTQQSAIISGSLSGTGGLVKTGAAVLQLTGTSSYTGDTMVQDGELWLNFTSTGTSASNLINPDSRLVLGGGGVGATLRVTSKSGNNNNSQTFDGTLVKAGKNSVILARGNGQGSTTVDLGAITREAGGLLSIAAGTNGTLGTTVNVNGSSPLTNGIIGGWATYLGSTSNSWATVDGGAVVALADADYTALTSLGGNAYTITSNAAANLKIDSSSTYSVIHNAYASGAIEIEGPGDNPTWFAPGDSITGTGIRPGTWVNDAINDPSGSFAELPSGYATTAAGSANTLIGARPITLAAGVTEVNTIQITDSSNRIIDIGAGNTLRLGKFGGIWRDVAAIASGSTGNRLTLEGGTLTAGGADNTAGEIVFNTGGGNTSGTNNTGSRPNRGIVVNSVIADNGTGKVSLIKTGFEALLLAGANTYTGDTYVLQGILESTVANNLGGAGAEVYVQSQTDGSSGQVLLSGAGNYANNFSISGTGPNVTPSTVGFTYGALVFGNTNATISGNITLLGNARIGAISGLTFPTEGHLISGKISGDYNLSFGSGSQIGVSVKLSNTGNDWGGDTILSTDATAGTGVDIWLGASEVLPHGDGKGNVVMDRNSDSGSAMRISLNGFNETINGLISSGDRSGETVRVIRNQHATNVSTLTIGAGNADGYFYGTIQDGGAAALNIAKTGTGTQEFSGVSTYTGSTTVNGGTLLISGTGTLTGTSGVTVNNSGTFAWISTNGLSRAVTANAGGTFRYNSTAAYTGGLTMAGGSVTGSGNLGATILQGTGTVDPGNSPGILTAAGTDGSAGLGYNFEFTAANAAPTWNAPSASGNDVLRLTSASAPFVSGLDADNAISIYLNLASISLGDVFEGGFFTDKNENFLSSINAAAYAYYVLGDGNGTHVYNGFNYYTLAEYDGGLTFDVDVIQVASANFADGTINDGWGSQFTVVAIPEPTTYLLIALGGVFLLFRRRHVAR